MRNLTNFKVVSGTGTAIAALVIGTALAISMGYRGLVVMLSTGVLVIGLGSLVVPLLRQLKAGQIIRDDGPQAHLKKGGTPTMGGIFIVPVGLMMGVIWTGFDQDVIACALLSLGFGLVGWLDDWQILKYKSNKGISPRLKLGLQLIFSLAFCGWLALRHWELTTVDLPFDLSLPLGLVFFPLVLFVLLGASNGTNLTDGLDGLAGGTGAIALIGMGSLLNQTSPQLAGFALCMGGSYLGFLWHNRNPAQIFMGDTGSLALGGAIATVAILGNLLWGLLIVGAIFIWEAISVILQVSYYKFTKNPEGVGQRLFKMAPYHHHLELSGWQETEVVGIFYLVQTGLVMVAIAILRYELIT